MNNQNIHHSSNRELVTYALQALPFAVKLHLDRRYDFCFAWSTVPAGGIAIALSCFTGLKYLIRVSGPDIPGFEDRYKVIYPILSPVIRFVWRRAQTVVAKCKTEADMIRAVDKSIDACIIPNGVNIEIFQPGELVPDNGPFRLLCVGRLIERKGQHHLIEAMKRLVDQGANMFLDLVGTGDAQPVNEAQVYDLGLSERVRLLGYISRENMPAHYANAHVFVLPSYNEGMSIATLEAMAAGLAVVVTRSGGTSELVEEGINGFTFDWGDVDTMAVHLRRLYANRSLTRRMGHESRARAACFSWDAAARSYLEIFEQMTRRTSIDGKTRNGNTLSASL